MKQKARILIGVLAVLGVFLLWKAPGYIQKARESEAVVNIASLETSLKVYFKEYSAYSDKFEALGYSQEGDLRYHLYLSADKICPGVRAKLSESQLPFVSKDSYRIVAIGYNSIFIKELDKPLVHEEIQVSLKELICDVKEN